MPIVIAHRGASAFAPEHTFAAYDLALDAGADYIEQDLQMTADGQLVVLHDDTLDRTTGGTCTGRVIETMYADIADCDAGSWFNAHAPHRARPEYTQLRIPRLAEAFARYAGQVAQAMQAQGYAMAPSLAAATMVVQLDYGVDEGEERVEEFWTTIAPSLQDAA